MTSRPELGGEISARVVDPVGCAWSRTGLRSARFPAPLLGTVAPGEPGQARLARAYDAIRLRVRHNGAIAVAGLEHPSQYGQRERSADSESSLLPQHAAALAMGYDRVVVVASRDDALLPLRP